MAVESRLSNNLRGVIKLIVRMLKVSTVLGTHEGIANLGKNIFEDPIADDLSPLRHTQISVFFDSAAIRGHVNGRQARRETFADPSPLKRDCKAPVTTQSFSNTKNRNNEFPFYPDFS